MASVECREYTLNIGGVSSLQSLEEICVVFVETKIPLIQASTSELYGRARETFRMEFTTIRPSGHWSVASLCAF